MKAEPTSVTNLVPAAESGVYYPRAKIRGKLVWRFLETKTFSVGKLRLPDTVRKLLEAAPAEIKMEPKITFGQAVELYRRAVNENARLKPRAKEFRLRSEFTFRRTWPEIFGMELRRITPEACKAGLPDSKMARQNIRPLGKIGNARRELSDDRQRGDRLFASRIHHRNTWRHSLSKSSNADAEEKAAPKASTSTEQNAICGDRCQHPERSRAGSKVS